MSLRNGLYAKEWNKPVRFEPLANWSTSCETCDVSEDTARRGERTDVNTISLGDDGRCIIANGDTGEWLHETTTQVNFHYAHKPIGDILVIDEEILRSEGGCIRALLYLRHL